MILGAVTIGDCEGIDPRALMLYMRDLHIDFLFDAYDSSISLKAKLISLARRDGYNVIALGNTLDKLAEDILKHMLHEGKLYTTPPSVKNWYINTAL